MDSARPHPTPPRRDTPYPFMFGLQPTRPLPWLVLALVGLVATWDYLFFRHPIGFTRGLFTLTATGVLLLVHPGAWSRHLVISIGVGLIVVAVSQIVEPTTLAAWLSWVGLASLGLVARSVERPTGAAWARAWTGFATLGWLTGLSDLAAMRAALAARSGWRGRVGRALGRWGLPTLLSVPFVLLFTAANPVIELGFDDLFTAIGALFRSISIERLLLWILVASGVWALLRFRPVERRSRLRDEWTARSREALRGEMLVRCLLVFNGLFAFQTLLDAGYFWSGFTLPDGMSYAEYAHRGAYPLVATTLLAMAFILAAFHDGRDDTPRDRFAKRLVLVWLAQNAFLLASAAARLDLYVEVYDLTYFRIASAIWMAIVALGLGWTAFKIATGRSNAWLIDVNLATAGVVLALACFPDYDRWIAEYNVERAIENPGRYLDVWYLRSLGPEALPALRRWWDTGRLDHDALTQAACMNDALVGQLEWRESSWRGDSMRLRALDARLDRRWGGHLPACGGMR